MFADLSEKVLNNQTYADLYFRALIRTNDLWYADQKDRVLLKRIVFYGVLYIIALDVKQMPANVLLEALKIAQYTRCFISYLTPEELMNIFPVEKIYTGKRFGTKDYFTTMKAIQEVGIENYIGSRLEDLLWDYQNQTMARFEVKYIGILSALRRMDGMPGLLEKMFDEHIEQYAYHEGGLMQDPATGQTFILDEKTHRTKPAQIKRRLPGYIRPVS